MPCSALGGTIFQMHPTVSLAHGSRYECRFGAQRVAASYGGDPDAVTTIRCRAPPLAVDGHMNSALRVKVHISLNAQQFAPLLLGIEAFTYLPAVGVTAVTPVAIQYTILQPQQNHSIVSLPPVFPKR